MKQKNKNRNKQWGKKRICKLVDEYTGAYIYSDQIEYDYKGLITRKDLVNRQVPIPEQELFIPVEHKPEFIRTPSIEPMPQLAYESDLIWDEWDEYYDITEVRW